MLEIDSLKDVDKSQQADKSEPAFESDPEIGMAHLREHIIKVDNTPFDFETININAVDSYHEGDHRAT